MNQTIVVTGGTKGIGRAIIMDAVARGITVFTCSRNAEDLASLRHSVNETGGAKIHTVVADLSVKEDAGKFIAFVQERTTTVTYLVNNAGMFVPGEIHSEADGVLEKMIETNLYSAYYVTRGLLPLIPAAGQIFNLCSTASFVPYVNGGSYCISKFALLGFSKVLREELKAKGIRVTSVMPGATLTASWEGVDIPEERFMKPGDISSAIWAAVDLSDRTVMEEIILRPQLGDL